MTPEILPAGFDVKVAHTACGQSLWAVSGRPRCAGPHYKHGTANSCRGCVVLVRFSGDSGYWALIPRVPATPPHTLGLNSLLK